MILLFARKTAADLKEREFAHSAGVELPGPADADVHA